MIFCDWLTIYQVHFQDLPIINDGRVFSVDSDGQIEWETNRKLVHKGSYDSKIMLSCDGHRVFLSGNVGRFNRADNLFGYGVLECVEIANKIVKEFNLPPFTSGKCVPIFRNQTKLLTVGSTVINDKNQQTILFENLELSADSDAGFIHDGACITRVDLTGNYTTGSPQNASNFILKLQGYKMGRFDPKSYGVSGVVWGIDMANKGSKFWVCKMYDKASDYIRHHSKDTKFFNPQLFDFMLSNGIVRHEATLKSRFLKQNGLTQIKNWNSEMEAKIYALFESPLHSVSRVDEFLEIPGRAGELAVAWRDGADLKKRLSKPTFYRYRKELLQFGIDICIPVNVKRIKTHVEVIELRPAVVPDWYHLPKVVG